MWCLATYVIDEKYDVHVYISQNYSLLIECILFLEKEQILQNWNENEEIRQITEQKRKIFNDFCSSHSSAVFFDANAEGEGERVRRRDREFYQFSVVVTIAFCFYGTISTLRYIPCVFNVYIVTSWHRVYVKREKHMVNWLYLFLAHPLAVTLKITRFTLNIDLVFFRCCVYRRFKWQFWFVVSCAAVAIWRGDVCVHFPLFELHFIFEIRVWRRRLCVSLLPPCIFHLQNKK